MKRTLLVVLAAAACTAAFVIVNKAAAARPVNSLSVIQVHRPWMQGNATDALVQAAGSSTIPMGSYTFTATKDNGTYTDVIVGRSPFLRSKVSTPVNVMIIPTIVQIGSSTFDPTAVDACVTPGTQTTVSMFQNSPIFQNVAWDQSGSPPYPSGHGMMMNGVNVGTTTYNDAFRRAEFWSLVGGTSYHTTFSVTTHSPITISSSTVASIGGGATFSSGCSLLGGLYLNPSGPGGDFDAYIQGQITTLGIPATTFPIFLMKNVVLSLSTPPNFSNCCVLGYHGAFGSPVQTYSPLAYDSTGDFAGIHDVSIATHEVGEWMDDPLGTNPTPAWGKIGQVSGCQGNWEVGDPLTGTNVPAVAMSNGVTYHLQEMAFWSWFYNAQLTASVGAGGKFSNNGTFGGPAKTCPSPGGTF